MFRAEDRVIIGGEEKKGSGRWIDESSRQYTDVPHLDCILSDHSALLYCTVALRFRARTVQYSTCLLCLTF